MFTYQSIEFKNVYAAMYVMNYFPHYNRFSQAELYCKLNGKSFDELHFSILLTITLTLKTRHATYTEAIYPHSLLSKKEVPL